MKKLLAGICILFQGMIVNAQTQGLENIIVEKYYISNANDSIGAAGNGDDLPVGSVTYRIFVDMLPGYKFQAAYGTQDNSGIPLHTLVLSTTTSFYNNTDRGHEIPSFSKTNAATHTTMLDSYFSVGAACANSAGPTYNYGILKSEDGAAGGANIMNANGILQNNDPNAGLPLTTADGIYGVSTPAVTSVTFVNMATQQSDFDGGPSSTGFITNNASWASLTGASGPTASNKVLIGQFTTNGCFHFELNIQIGTPTGGFQNYVASNPTGNEILFPGLTYPLASASTASVNVSANPSGPVCSGTNVVFTAIPTNGGNNPVFQWIKNGFNVGTGLTYSDNSLVNSDQVSCVMTSNLQCISGNPDTSNIITMTVNAGGTAAVNITADPTGPVCAGTNVTFTASSINGGAAPIYQWIKNGVNVGSGGITYSDNLLADNDQISCVMTSNLPCVTGSPDTSNNIVMTVNTITASVSISADPSGPICQGTNVTLTAVPTNGGISPVFQWKKNGLDVGTGGTTYSDNSLVNSDQVSCIMTSDLSCVSGNPATSNIITMTVNAIAAASVSITSNNTGAICGGKVVKFTAIPINGGPSPTYQWKKNGNNVGLNSPVFSNTSNANNFSVSCVMTSNAACATGNPATSNTINIQVNPSPTVTITGSGPTTFCSGANPLILNSNASPGVTYQWQKGSNIISGATNNSYVPSVSATYKTVVTNINGCTGASNGIVVTVNPIPAASVTASGPLSFCTGDSVVLQANNGAGLNYQWAKGNNSLISGATSQNYVAKTDGYYKVIVTNSLTGCAKYSGLKHVIVNCRNGNIITEETIDHLTIFPNPTDGPFTVSLNTTKIENGSAQIELINVLGQSIFTGTTPIFNGELSLQLNAGSSLPKGLYFVKINLNGVEYDSKIVLQ